MSWQDNKLPTGLTVTALASVLLAGCFNGDPGLGEPADTTPTETSCPTPPAAVSDLEADTPVANPAFNPGRFVFARQALTETAEQFVAQANEQGALGFRYNAPYSVGGDTGHLYICDTANPSAWTYRTERWIEGALSLDGIRELLDEQGSEGYRYLGREQFIDGVYLTFVNNGSRAERFSYRLEAASFTTDAFIDQANTLGELEYRFSERFALTTTDASFIEIYRRDTVTPQRRVYASRDVAETPAAFVNQANALGADGFRYWIDLTIDGLSLQSIYIRNTTAAGVYAVATQPVSDTLGRLIIQADTQGTDGLLRLFDGQWTSASQTNRTVFLDVNGCNCEPLELADRLVD